MAGEKLSRYNEWHEGMPTGPRHIRDVLYKWAQPKSNQGIRFTTISSALAEAMSQGKLIKEVEHMLRIHQTPFNWNSLTELDDLFGADHTITLKKSSFHTVDTSTGFSRPIPYPEYGANMVHRSMWHAWRAHASATGWPDKFDSKEHVSWAIDFVLQNPDLLLDVEKNMAWRVIQTSYPERMVGPLMALQAFGERFTDPIKMVSVGHSLALGEKKLLLGRPFRIPEVLDWKGFSENLGVDQNLTNILTERIPQHPGIERIYGVDIFPADQASGAREWAMSSFYPDEQMNKPFMAEVNYLNDQLLDNFVSVTGDFSTQAGLSELEESMAVQGDKDIDVFYFGTVWYQLPKEAREKMLFNALDKLRPDGLVILQDFVEPRPLYPPSANPVDELHFPNEWSRWSYRLHVLDIKIALEGHAPKFEQVMSFNNGRCGQVLFSENFKNKYFSG